MSRIGYIVGGRYRLLTVLGEGGMGTLYEAINTWSERHVALKMLRAQGSSERGVLARFLREGRAVSRLEHPHIVQVLDMGQDDDGALFIVQELLRGQDLRRWLDARRRVTPSEAVALVLPIADALCAAHEQGIVHRDVKPENIFLSRTNAGKTLLKLIDFGVAGDAGAAGTEALTGVGGAPGTAGYMSPEQARGDVDLGAQTDVWSLGVVLFELLTGRRPFEGSNPNVVVAQLLTTSPPRADAVLSSVPADLAALVARALEPDRVSRFASMSALHAALRAWAEPHTLELPSLPLTAEHGASVGAGQSETVRVTEEVPSLTATLPSRAPVPRRRRALALAGAGAGALLLGALSLALWRPLRARPAPAPSAPVRLARAQPAPTPLAPSPAPAPPSAPLPALATPGSPLALAPERAHTAHAGPSDRALGGVRSPASAPNAPTWLTANGAPLLPAR